MSMFINIFSVTTVSLSTLNIPSVIYPRQTRESLRIFQFPQRHKNFWPHIKNKIDIVYLDNNWKIQIINETHSTFLLLKYSKRNLQYENLDISMRKIMGRLPWAFSSSFSCFELQNKMILPFGKYSFPVPPSRERIHCYYLVFRCCAILP